MLSDAIRTSNSTERFAMNLAEKSDSEILIIADPIMDNLSQKQDAGRMNRIFQD
jgi:hypothetical protein